jgi:hypothetical protein
MREQMPAVGSQFDEQHALLSVHASPSKVHSGPLLLLPPQAASRTTMHVMRTFFMIPPG